jgi:protein-tyrosine phosphatase
MSYHILFVCTGNICRSPTAEGVFQHYLANSSLKNIIRTDSAGTQNQHAGEAPDPRSVAAAKKRDIDLTNLKARKVTLDDFANFDLVLACDNSHLTHLKNMAPQRSKANIDLYLSYAGIMNPTEVPDPYYGSHRDFEYVLDLVQNATQRLIGRLQKELG